MKKAFRRAVLAGLAAAFLCGCGGDGGGGDADAAAGGGAEVLTGDWEVSQVTLDGTTTPVTGLSTTGILTLNEDGSFVLETTGLIASRYTGSYTAAGGRFTMAVNETGRTVTGTYELSSGLLELTMNAPITVLTTSIQGAAFVRD